MMPQVALMWKSSFLPPRVVWGVLNNATLAQHTTAESLPLAQKVCLCGRATGLTGDMHHPATSSDCGKLWWNSRRYKVDAVFKGKRSMFPSSGPLQDYGVSHFDKQKRRTAEWLERERRRIATLPEPLRPLEVARALSMYKDKLIELYGDDYVRREWATLFKLTRTKLMGAE
uniref:Uncharacterized protein n=1 Tax=Neospora caninum (strain Liverpool) TaxID=572307 RepID=A0A0F7U6Q7_NEOCL|nr:TPA: hypothetical protein BN1204_006755 [Neospora caninum Liverpool]